MAEEDIHIEFERSGGFTGRSTHLKIDSRDLDPEEAEALKHLIEDSGFFEAMAMESGFMNFPDQFRYQITVEHAGKRRTLELTDGHVPDHIRPLINYLVSASRRTRNR